jgi:metallo-beta-lactamase class B
MMNELFNAVSPEEAAVLSKSKPFLPYNPDPVVSKIRKDRPVQLIEPLKVFDNVWWMGTSAVGALVIDTGEGLLMIDCGSNDSEAAHIAGSFAKMGLDASSVKLIVVSHEHYDHYGGVPYFLKNVCPDAMLAMSRVGWNLLQTVPTEFAFSEPRPDKIDILMDDGLCMQLGNTKLLCVATPGHSAGCFSFIFNSSLHGDALSAGVMGGSAVWPNFPEARLYENSIEYFKLFTDIAGCNAFSAVHQKAEELDKVRDHWDKGMAHPWVCAPEDYDAAYLQGFRDKAENTIYSGNMQPYMMPNGAPEGSPLPPRRK